MKIQKNYGFTLIELLVAMGIMAILTGLAAFNFNQSRVRARDVQRKSDMNQLQKALELYKNDNNEYPPDDDQNRLKSPVEYIKSTFSEPRGSEWVSYMYRPGVNNKTYHYMACLENSSDASKTTDTALCSLFTTDVTNTCKCGKTSDTKTGVMYIISNP